MSEAPGGWVLGPGWPGLESGRPPPWGMQAVLHPTTGPSNLTTREHTNPYHNIPSNHERVTNSCHTKHALQYHTKKYKTLEDHQLPTKIIVHALASWLKPHIY